MTLARNGTIDWTKVPVPRMADGIRRYVERGIPPGHFLTALLSNDLQEAVGRADEDNSTALAKWAVFLHCELPSGCHGSSERCGIGSLTKVWKELSKSQARQKRKGNNDMRTPGGPPNIGSHHAAHDGGTPGFLRRRRKSPRRCNPAGLPSSQRIAARGFE